MARLRLSQIDLWQQHASAVMNVLRRAADLMIAGGDRGLEPDLNRQLLLYLHQATRDLEQQGAYVPSTYPMLEAQNQPAPSTKGASSEDKRPDLQWGYRDSQIPDSMDAIRTFYIECKRIGTASLDPLYVKEGVWRFIDKIWSYGRNVTDGAMVGYVEGKGPDSALMRVNAASASAGVPTLTQVSEYGARRELGHELIRNFEKSPFRLYHVWIDTRTSQAQSAGQSSTQPPDETEAISAVADDEGQRA